MHIILCHFQTFLVYISVCTILPLLFPLIFLYKLFILTIARVTQPDLHKTFNPVDTILEEDISYAENIPKCSILNSVLLSQPISLQELKSLFTRNVLHKTIESKSSLNNNEDLRYPELQQYPTLFMGYAFWKSVKKFKIEDHIIELFYNEKDQPTLSEIHEEMLNKPFTPKRSPWQLILINNFSEDPNYLSRKTLIIGRFHHSIADAKSILKLFVEGLGNQPLNTAVANKVDSSLIKKLTVPFNFTWIILNLLYKASKYFTHDWKIKKDERERNDRVRQLVRISDKLSLADIKEVGRKSGGTMASVILAIISGSIRNLKETGDIYSVYILPKDNHPETLGNHAAFGAIILPTGETDIKQRLIGCHKAFQKLKASEMGKYLELPLYVMSCLMYPLRGIVTREVMSSSPIGITNIAGETKGFEVGGVECEEFIFSVGTLLGDSGIVFCISSYKQFLRIVVISKGGILDEIEADKLAGGMGKELENLKVLSYRSS